MSSPHVLLFLMALSALATTGILLSRHRRRRRALATPFPERWGRIIESNIPPYAKLSPSLQRQVQRYIVEFLYDKSFEGCGGLTLTDEIRVTIAAQASLLLLNREVRCYPKLYSILVYPSTYVARDGNDEAQVRLGESWRTGAVVLAWDSVKRGASNFADGRNLVIHEFAHQLDQEDGAGDGAPALGVSSSYAVWARVLSREYDRLQARSRRGKRSTLDAYGATNPAEFFAVASETFFEKPDQMRKKHPELYGELQKFYNVNPADWA